MNRYDLDKKIVFDEENSFIIAPNDSIRRMVFLELEKNFNFELNRFSNTAVYVNDFIKNEKHNKENINLSICSRIIRNIIFSNNNLNNELNQFTIDFVNIFVKKNIIVKNIYDLLDLLEFEKNSCNKEIIPFIDIDIFLDILKKNTGINSTISVILNCEDGLSFDNKNDILSIMNTKYTNKINIKTATNINDWEDDDRILDFNVIEFDDSYEKYVNDKNSNVYTLKRNKDLLRR